MESFFIESWRPNQLAPAPVLAPPPLSQDEAPEEAVGRQPGLPKPWPNSALFDIPANPGPTRCAGTVFVWRTHFHPLCAASPGPKDMCLFCKPGVCKHWRRDSSKPGRHTPVSLSMIWACCYKARLPPRVVTKQCGKCLCQLGMPAPRSRKVYYYDPN